MSEDERALRERLAALEAEVKAESDAATARKQAAIERLRVERAEREAEKRALGRDAQVARRRGDEGGDSQTGDLAGAIELARRAHGVKEELTRPRAEHEKSWLISGGASMLFGPIGWLYAGSFREAVPAATATVLLAFLVSKFLPMILLMPALLVLLPLSGIAGIVYALSYNREGKRARLFDRDKKGKPRALPRGR